MNKPFKSYTHVALVLDASGSMTSLRGTTVASLKKFFSSFQLDEDKVIVDVWQFDDRVRHLISGMSMDNGAAAAIEGYATGGCTALYDAICTGIDELGKTFAAMPESDRPGAVVFAILTDGFENASRHFAVQEVRNRIEHQSSKYSWKFQFLAANQDAVLTGQEMGLEEDDCYSMASGDAGIVESCRCMAMCCADGIAHARRVREAK